MRWVAYYKWLRDEKEKGARKERVRDMAKAGNKVQSNGPVTEM